MMRENNKKENKYKQRKNYYWLNPRFIKTVKLTDVNSRIEKIVQSGQSRCVRSKPILYLRFKI